MTSVFSTAFWMLCAAALLISSIGFYKYVYFISLGYGFSIAGLGILMVILFQDGSIQVPYWHVCFWQFTDAGLVVIC